MTGKKYYVSTGRHQPNGKAVFSQNGWLSIYEPKKIRYPIRWDNILFFILVIGFVIKVLSMIF